jgi:hypothetical protein
MRLNQTVQTPKGEAGFIAFIDDGSRVQVSRKVPALEFTRDECTCRKISLAELSQIEFINWQRSATFTINEIYPIDQVTL